MELIINNSKAQYFLLNKSEKYHLNTECFEGTTKM